MQLTALVDSPDHVCCRYRLTAFRPLLARAGHTLELQALPHRWWSRLHLFRSLRGANVVFQRRLLPGWQVALMRRCAERLLFDFDDAVFLRDSYSRRGLHHPGRLRRFAALARACDAVVAGNAFLAARARRWAAPHAVHVIPTCVEPRRYPPAEHVRTNPGVQLAWVGSSSTLRGLEAVAPLLEELGQRVPGLRLKLICDRSLALRHLPVLFRPWSEGGEAGELAGADVGISWVPDDLWSRGKCGLKVLQYMAAGLPVVANPVGVHVEMVSHGETGFLAETPAQWFEAVSRLARDPGLRRRLGRAGRRRVEADYSVAAGAERWLALLDGLRQPAPDIRGQKSEVRGQKTTDDL
jgi:glycosyltransferase involved in cell wall biosynthesis